MKGIATKDNGLSSLLHGKLKKPSCGQGDEQYLAENSGEDWSMSAWPTCAVLDSFMKTKVGRKYQIPARDIAQIGEFPVVDQGQKFIAGYCDDQEKLIDFDLPLIIFGDHTRCIKYVDFPFVLGADGTKVLAPNKNFYDPKFYYFALMVLEIPSRGYNRHFKILKERSLPLPPLPEQKKIAHILSTVQRAIEAQERIIQTTTELKKALMRKLFTEGLRNEPQKQTEIGPIPESWEFTKIGEIAQLKSGGTPSRKNSAFWDDGDISWIKTGEIDYTRIVRTEEKITNAGLEGSSAKIFPAGTLLIAMYGQGVTRGKVAITGMDAATNQACAAIFPLAEVRTKYLYYFLEYNYDTIRSFAHGANQKNLSADLIKSFQIAYPSIASEQREIAGALGIIDRRIAVAQTKKRQLQNLFRTLLHELMSAKIRVTTTTNGTTDHEKLLY